MTRAPANPLLKATLATLKDDPSGLSVRSFVQQAAADSAPDELPELTAADVAANLADFWRFGERRKGKGPSIRVAPVLGDKAHGLDRLEIVQDDAPFLVDSIMGEVAERGLSVRAMVHPIVEVRRDRTGLRGATGAPRRESMIQVILDPIGADREAALAAGIAQTLADVRAAVEDFPQMLALMARTVTELEAHPGKARPEEIAFLNWLEAEQFVFLGARLYEYPRLKTGEYAAQEPVYQAKDGLGVLRDSERTVLRRANEPAILMGQVKDRLLSDPAVTVAKSNVRSRVHRRGYMDYVGIKRYDADGRPTGEVRFVGLFTAEAYDQPSGAVPLVREKVANVLRRAAAVPGGHNEKRLKNIVENHPRDELFQMSEDDLLAEALGILHLYDRPRVKIFERRDPFDRFASVLLFLPRDRYNAQVAQQAGALLADAWKGRVSAAYPSFSDAPLARVHYILGLNFLVSNQIDLAIEELTHAASLDADALEVHMILGNLYREKGQVGKAITIHQTLLQRQKLSRMEHAYVLLCLGAHQLISDCFAVAFIVQAVTLRQTVLPRHMLGRANAAVHVCTAGMLPVAALVAGGLAELFSVRTAVWIGVASGLLAPLCLLPLRHLGSMPEAASSTEMPRASGTS